MSMIILFNSLPLHCVDYNFGPVCLKICFMHVVML